MGQEFRQGPVGTVCVLQRLGLSWKAPRLETGFIQLLTHMSSGWCWLWTEDLARTVNWYTHVAWAVSQDTHIPLIEAVSKVHPYSTGGNETLPRLGGLPRSHCKKSM